MPVVLACSVRLEYMDETYIITDTVSVAFKLDGTHFLIVPEGSQSFGLLHLHSHQQLNSSIILDFSTALHGTIVAHPSLCSSYVPNTNLVRVYGGAFDIPRGFDHKPKADKATHGIELLPRHLIRDLWLSR